MEKYLFYVLCIAMVIITMLIVPAGTISVSANKPGGVREVIPAAVEVPKPQPATQEGVVG
jgi:hypothetical protein